MSLLTTISNRRASLLRSLRHLESVPPFVARYVLGITFVSTGWAKLHDLGAVTSFFGSLELPVPGFMAGLVGLTELACGGLLLLGLASRLAAVPLVVTMIVALATAKRAEINSLPALFGMIETGYVVLLLYVAILGPGALSIDGFIAYQLDRRVRGARVWRAAPGVASEPA